MSEAYRQFGTNMQEGSFPPSVSQQITQDQIDHYARASGDFNPIHIDPQFAASSHFGKRVAHGMLIAALISEMMTRSFSGDWLRSGWMKLRFKAPVFPGDIATARGVVKSVVEDESSRTILCSVEVVRQNSEIAITGEASVVVSCD